MNSIEYICKRFTEKSRPYNILTFATHEGYQTLLSNTEHNFYLLDRPDLPKKWDDRYRPLPKNHFIIQNVKNIDIDFILTQERFRQYQIGYEISKLSRLPIVHLEHIEPQDRWSKEQFHIMKNFRGDINVYITEHNKNKWECEEGIVIPHGINTDKYQGWNHSNNKKYVLYVVNQLKDRDYFCGYHVWNDIKHLVQEKDPDIEFILVGDNPGISSPISNEETLIRMYNNCVCYLNTSQLSPVPLSLLEAMSCGCPIVSTAKQEIPKIVNDSINGFCTNDIPSLVNSIIQLSNDKELSLRLGKEARQTIIDKFSLDNFVKNWNNIFDKAYNIKIGRLTTNVVN